MTSLLRVGAIAACFSLIPICAVAQSESDRRGPKPHGSAWKLFGNAEMTRDPENRENIVLEVISVGAPEFTAAGAFRDLRHVKLWHLDHQLNFHRAFVAPNTCDGGSPRMTLIIDADGDGRFDQFPNGMDFAAHGHVRPPFAGCETSAPTGADDEPSQSTLLWRFEDLTDEQVRWEVTPSTATNPPIGPIGGAGALPWDAFEAAVSLAFPEHQVLRAILVEDFNATAGTAYYDLITALELTLGTEGQDKAPNPGPGQNRDND
jgi:hypothetical protein